MTRYRGRAVLFPLFHDQVRGRAVLFCFLQPQGFATRNNDDTSHFCLVRLQQAK